MSKVFWVSSAVRSVHTRLTRAQAPERARFKQFIMGGSLRLVRNRPLVITEEQLKLHSAELEAKCKAGLIEIRDSAPDGPVHTFAKKRKRRSSIPPPPPHKEEANTEEPEEKLEEPQVEKEPAVEKPAEEFVPVEEPTKRRGRKPKKG